MANYRHVAPGIQQRYNRYYAYQEIPKDVRHLFLSKKSRPLARFVQSLETTDLREAKQLAPALIAQWKDKIDAARNTGDQAANLNRLLTKAKMKGDRTAIEQVHKDVQEAHADIAENVSIVTMPGGGPYDLVEYDRAEEAAHKRADDFAERALSEKHPLVDFIDAWLEHDSVASRTAAMRRAEVERFAKHCPTTDTVTKCRVNDYVRVYGDGKAWGTVKKTLQYLRGFWSYLEFKDVVDDTIKPFDGLKTVEAFKQKGRKANGKKRGEAPFQPADVTRLMNEATDTLRDLVTLAAYTGCRAEELCSLRVKDVHADHFHIAQGKTKDAVRDVPIHPSLQQTVQRLLDEANAATSDYLLSGLSVDKHGNRYPSIKKRFTELKRKLGFGPEHVFHSLRKTVATQLENHEVPEVVSARILGHRLNTMSYGIYSGGVALKVKADALAKVEYPN